MPDQWMVIVTGPRLIEELRRFPDDTSSFYDAASDLFELDTSFGPDLKEDPFHVALLRGQLTRNLGNMFPNMMNEMKQTFDDLLPVHGDGWIRTPLLVPVIQKLVARVSNYAFVGYPMCRHDKYLELAIKHSDHIAWTRKLLIMFPRPLKYLVARFARRTRNNVLEGQKILLPLIQERIRIVKNNDKDNAPQDVLQYITEAALSKNKGIEGISRSIFATNWAAIHTSSSTFVYALLDLAAHPDYASEMREEVERVIGEEGWTKDAMTKLWKVDSFMRESLRLNGMSAVSMFRKTRKPVVFSNGVRIPAGTILVAAARDTHMDEEYYPDPHTFDPWRSYRKRVNSEREVEGELYSSYSPTHLHFGLGKHAWYDPHVNYLRKILSRK
ncbi:hypothetical protein QCA50_016345 [Cerrena zonata]|uniref:Cytochrome P450 n=1 Tax=Cerrena zonata TaxID=2478898 RepID=A0AAW0FHJ2_9APHY